MSALKQPLNFNLIRANLVKEVQRITGCTCILEESGDPNSPRPPKPYFSLKMTTPSARLGGDSSQYISQGPQTGLYNQGGQRRMSVSFHCYAQEKEDAYGLMTLLQGAFELWSVRDSLRGAGIAVWQNGNVADLTELLNTGYEGRAQMDVQFGLASNMVDNLGTIESVEITSEIKTDSGTVEQRTSTVKN